MKKEIERRYLAEITGIGLLCANAIRIVDWEQGYIATGETQVRVSAERSFANNSLIDFELGLKTGTGLVRSEIEWPLDEETGLRLLDGCLYKLCKTRYYVGGWEIDQFTDQRFCGLVLAEYEFASEEEANHTPIPPSGVRLICEVTDNKDFENQNLAKLYSSLQMVACIRSLIK